MILDISGKPEVTSGDYGGVYEISPAVPGLLIASAGSLLTFSGKIIFVTSTAVFNANDTYFKIYHTRLRLEPTALTWRLGERSSRGIL
jgi:hypothetical protein